MIDIWEQQSFKETMQAVLLDMRFSAATVVRIGYQGQEGAPTLWVGISSESKPIDFETIRKGITSCQKILHAHGLKDVEVEVYESKIQVAMTQSQESDEPNLSLGLEVGHCIAAETTPRGEGTLGLFLRGKNSGRTFGLTCQHVVHPGYLLDRGCKTTDIGVQVISPGSTLLAEKSEAFSDSEHPKSKAIKEKLKYLEPVASRVIGEVLVSPQFGVHTIHGVEQGDDILQDVMEGRRKFPPNFPLTADWCQDWALLRIDPDKCANGAPSNLVKLGIFDSLPIPVQRELSRGDNFYDPKAEVRVQLKYSKHEDPSWRGHVVGKVGRATRLRWGRANEIMGWWVQYVKDLEHGEYAHKFVVSDYLCVISLDETDIFASDGDSGSAVFKVEDGEVISMATAVDKAGDHMSYSQMLGWIMRGAETEVGEPLEVI